MELLAALGYFTIMAGFFLAKLFPVWGSAIPGGLEDTRLFLWNAWWFHHAVSILHTNPFHTTLLFFPYGCRLVSHDFPLWMNLITFFGQQAGLSMVAASNIWFGLSWILLGFCTYGLAREVTNEPTAAIAAGTLAMTHSYTLARAMQNWGQFNAYGIALFLWCLVRARRRNTPRTFIWAGIALAWTAACHYYFLIYSFLIWMAVAAVDLSPYTITISKTSSPPDLPYSSSPPDLPYSSSPAASGGGPTKTFHGSPSQPPLRGEGTAPTASPWLAIGATNAFGDDGGDLSRGTSGTTKIVRRFLFGLAVISGTIGILISFHPGIVHAAGLTIGMQSPDNVLFVMWIALMILGASYLRIRVSSPAASGGGPIKTHHGSPTKAFGDDGGIRMPETTGDGVKLRLRHHLLLLGTASVFLLPLFWESLNLIRSGGYPKQSILWKTHLPGANLLALFAPNPLHALWGPAVSRWFTLRGMNPQEQAAGIGWICIAVVLLSYLWQRLPSPPPSPLGEGRGKGPSEAQSEGHGCWLALALAATVLSLGTHLHIAQHNLWCPLPFFWFRLLPVLGNVRVPERWMAVGAVAWAVVLALALVRLAQARGWPLRNLSALATALILLENWPGVPFRPLPVISPVYALLRSLPPGAVLPVPLYIGDSSIGVGNAVEGRFIFPWDHLWAQITHQKPVVGGYIGRIPRHLIEAYQSVPFTRTLLALEENKVPVQPPQPAEGLKAAKSLNFRYVLVYPESTDPQTLAYVLGSLPLTLLNREEGVELYEVTGPYPTR